MICIYKQERGVLEANSSRHERTVPNLNSTLVGEGCQPALTLNEMLCVLHKCSQFLMLRIARHLAVAPRLHLSASTCVAHSFLLGFSFVSCARRPNGRSNFTKLIAPAQLEARLETYSLTQPIKLTPEPTKPTKPNTEPTTVFKCLEQPSYPLAPTEPNH